MAIEKKRRHMEDGEPGAAPVEGASAQHLQSQRGTAEPAKSTDSAAASKPQKFLPSLYAMVEAESEGDRSVVWGGHTETWPHDAFTVVNKAHFEAVVLPKYYRHSNFTSFVRQLNQYGFRKVAKDTLSWAEQNGNFRRGHPELLNSIVRTVKRRPRSSQSSASATNVDSATNAAISQQSDRPLIEFGNFGAGSGTPNGPGPADTLANGDECDGQNQSNAAIRTQVDRLARDQGILIHELIRMRRQQRRAIEVVSDLTCAVTHMKRQHEAMDQQLGMCMRYFGQFMHYAASTMPRDGNSDSVLMIEDAPHPSQPPQGWSSEEQQQDHNIEGSTSDEPPSKRQRCVEQIAQIDRTGPSIVHGLPGKLAPRTVSGALAHAASAVSDLIEEHREEDEWALGAESVAAEISATEASAAGIDSDNRLILPEVMLLPAPSFSAEEAGAMGLPPAKNDTKPNTIANGGPST